MTLNADFPKISFDAYGFQGYDEYSFENFQVGADNVGLEFDASTLLVTSSDGYQYDLSEYQTNGRSLGLGLTNGNDTINFSANAFYFDIHYLGGNDTISSPVHFIDTNVTVDANGIARWAGSGSQIIESLYFNQGPGYSGNATVSIDANNNLNINIFDDTGTTGTISGKNIERINVSGDGDHTVFGNDFENMFRFDSTGTDIFTAGGGRDFISIGKRAGDITFTDYQEGEWISLDRGWGFNTTQFAQELQSKVVDHPEGEYTYFSVSNSGVGDKINFLKVAGAYSIDQIHLGYRGSMPFSDGNDLFFTLKELVNNVPTGSVTISGTLTQGETLTANTTDLSDPDGLTSLSYQWLRDGVAIEGATASTYFVTQGDVSSALSVTVSYTDGQGFDEAVTSAATDAVENLNDAPTGSVTIFGTLTQGETLTANTTYLSDPDGLGSLSYQWLRDGVAIEGATAATYFVTQYNVSSALSVAVSYIDGYGTEENMTSAAVYASTLYTVELSEEKWTPTIYFDGQAKDVPYSTLKITPDTGGSISFDLPSSADFADDFSYDGERFYLSFPGDEEPTSFSEPAHYAYAYQMAFNDTAIAVVYSGERYHNEHDTTLGEGLLRFYDFEGRDVTNTESSEIIFTDQTDQGHQHGIYALDNDRFLILFQTNNPLGMPRLEPDTGYIVGRIISGSSRGMGDTFVIADDTSLITKPPEISVDHNGIISFSWEEYVDNRSSFISGTVVGGSINDLIDGSGGADLIYGHGGKDVINGQGGDDIIDGGSGSDTLVGGDGDDVVDGGEGDDLIVGGSGLGDDEYFGGMGSDTIKYISATAGIQVNLSRGTARSASQEEDASIGTDTIFDVENITSGRFDDILLGNSASNSISGLGGDDKIRGKGGNDDLKGGHGDDNIKGGGGSDNIKGNGGSDVIKAGGGADTVKGGGGADVINGGGGDDFLRGGGGNDTITGKGGDDTLKGNGGADVFQFRASDRNDTILDFRQGQDLIEIQTGANSFAALDIEQDGQDVLIGFGTGQVRVVTDGVGAFDENDFIF
ncbi:MAG: hypothetical protein P8Q48_16370 [Paracoccaceae bacterium]|nr:hypothetical protein [Paracoccaceae bacterium]